MGVIEQEDGCKCKKTCTPDCVPRDLSPAVDLSPGVVSHTRGPAWPLYYTFHDIVTCNVYVYTYVKVRRHLYSNHYVYRYSEEAVDIYSHAGSLTEYNYFILFLTH